MSLSPRPIPFGTKITIWDEPVLGQWGAMALSPQIASVFARWSALEKQLNQLFTLVTEGDQNARTDFDQLKGWDRRVDKIINEAAARLDQAVADIVKVVLRLVKGPGGKRDELAHRVWAVAEGFEAELALLPPDDQHALAEAVLAMKKAGKTDAEIDNASFYEGSSLVSGKDLDELILEMERAKDRMRWLIIGHFYPPFADKTGGGFLTYREKLADDGEVSARLINVLKERRKAGKAAQRMRTKPESQN